MVALGWCKAFQAKLWRVSYEFRLAWDVGYQRVILKVDSQAVKTAIHRDRMRKFRINYWLRSV